MSSSIEILEVIKITPPQNSVETTKIPLTFFDMPWILAQPVEKILFYEFPHPTMYFTQSILPQLKHSLSLVLESYFPLAGSLVCPPLPMEPYISYQSGDFVALKVAQSDKDFHLVVQNDPKNVVDLRPLVPHLSNEISSLVSRDDDDDDQVLVKVVHPLLALQVTIFPNSGISICWSYRHVAGDGRTTTNFIKSWASLFKSKNDLSVVAQPFHDRATLINDPNGLLSLMCRQWHELGISLDSLTTSTTSITSGVKLEGRLHATFVLSSHEITLLRIWITSRFDALDEPSPLPYVSTFVVTCAFIWVCLSKTKIYNTFTDDTIIPFGFLADCTEKQELQVPKTYIGNCLSSCVASLTKKELVSENGLLIAAKVIMQKIKELETGFLDKMPRWLPEGRLKLMSSSAPPITISNSPKLRVYETDFGWGKPKKIEVVHINKAVGSFSLAESRDDKDSVEVGISLSKIDMEAFTSIFEHGLNNFGLQRSHLAKRSLKAIG